MWLICAPNLQDSQSPLWILSRTEVINLSLAVVKIDSSLRHELPISQCQLYKILIVIRLSKLDVLPEPQGKLSLRPSVTLYERSIIFERLTNSPDDWMFMRRESISCNIAMKHASANGVTSLRCNNIILERKTRASNAPMIKVTNC